jgi:uncharacterized protein with ParB-like and HNH nuclease domain
MEDNDKIIEQERIDLIAEEQDDFFSNDDLYNISSWGADLSFRELIDRYKDGDLVKPEMQRNYVWDKAEASRFIDSILLGLPVPSIFLSKTSDEKMLIVDGYQRVMTVYDYVRGIFSKDKKSFQLLNSEKINIRWRGKTFEELSESEKRKIKNTTIHCIIFSQLKPRNDTSLYQVFERINTSGRTLVPQEIRNCIYQGSFNKLLINLNSNKQWRELYGTTIPDPRMSDIEYVLRALAFFETPLTSFSIEQISKKKFLNDFMGSDESKKEEILIMREEKFTRAIDFIYKNIGKTAFQNLSENETDKFTGKFNPLIFDSIMVAANDVITNQKAFSTVQIIENRYRLLCDQEYQDLIRNRTTRVERIRSRFIKAEEHLFGLKYE